jgi:hypothetical protein
MIKFRQWLILAGIVFLSALLAFRLSGIVYAMIVLPLSYLLWLLKLLYHALPGIIWWSLLIIVVLYILVSSLLPEIKFGGKIKTPLRPARGSVENLAHWADRSKRGNYFKWLVANRLGKIAHQILEIRMAGKKRSFFDPLTASDWEPSIEIQSYLEAGLQGSFADYPRSDSYFSQPVKTPLDHDVREVIEFLEGQIDNHQEHGV